MMIKKYISICLAIASAVSVNATNACKKITKFRHLDNAIATYDANGEYREMFATTNKALVERHIVGTGVSRELYATTAVYDVEIGAWRSFRWESIVKVY